MWRMVSLCIIATVLRMLTCSEDARVTSTCRFRCHHLTVAWIPLRLPEDSTLLRALLRGFAVGCVCRADSCVIAALTCQPAKAEVEADTRCAESAREEE